MQLSPLQSRLAASLVASCLILAIYIFLFSSHFALAVELSGVPLDHDASGDVDSWMLEHMWADEEDLAEPLDLRNSVYEPDFAPFDRSIIGRAPVGVMSLVNNVAQKTNLNQGESSTFVFEVASISGREAGETTRASELRRRSEEESQDRAVRLDGDTGIEDDNTGDLEMVRRATPTKTLWISANTCLQPNGLSANQTSLDPPQLTLFVSTSSENTSPGLLADQDKQKWFVFNEGAVMYNTTLTEDVYFTVTAPNVSTEFSSRLYNVEVATSVDQSYHSFDDTTAPNLVWVDSDAKATLLTTGNLTARSDEVITKPPYTMFGYARGDTSVNGVRNSYCGLQEYAQIGGRTSGLPSDMIVSGMTRRGDGNVTKQEFYFSGLNSSTVYLGILARDPEANSTAKRDNTPGGGGVVFKPTEFDTKSTGTCTIIFNLTFCDQNAYAVPGNTQNFANASLLAQFYDSYAKTMYDNFNKAMQQIPCETTNTSKYSLVRGCDDCKTAYKNWVCSVAIPRCEDFSSTDDFLQMRNIKADFLDGTKVPQDLIDQFGNTKAFNSSRLPAIDEQVQPGPYKEVLPCEDLCYDIVQSCPASLGFGCPQPTMVGFNTSYGRRTTGGSNVTCNYPGSAHYASASSGVSIPWITTAGLIGACALLLS
ncbi:stretch-activated Ca2+-permeable channel component-domain-containing protein [Xylariales sp. AK1849]|nr:stretch-activated Ca2+-permeable channel component-domain-containing protein [Xylariales sp. AK1849]